MNYNYKFLVIAALISCAYAAYIKQESAASPSQIKYAESQNYDQTGPSANNKKTQSTPPQQFEQSQFAAYSQQPQLLSQPQEYSQQQYFLPQQQIQSFAQSHQNQINSPRPSPSFQSQFAYSQPALQYSQAQQSPFAYQPQNLKQIQVNSLQQDYDGPQQGSFEGQDILSSKLQYYQPQQQISSLILQQPQQEASKFLYQQPQAQQAVQKFIYQQAQPQGAPLTAYVPKQTPPAPQIYQSLAAQSPKAFYPTPVSPLAKYQPSQQQYFYRQ